MSVLHNAAQLRFGQEGKAKGNLACRLFSKSKHTAFRQQEDCATADRIRKSPVLPTAAPDLLRRKRKYATPPAGGCAFQSKLSALPQSAGENRARRLEPI